VYVDDIIKFSENIDNHLAHLYKNLECLIGSDWRVTLKKCKIASTEISFLGHLIDAEGNEKQPE